MLLLEWEQEPGSKGSGAEGVMCLHALPLPAQMSVASGVALMGMLQLLSLAPLSCESSSSCLGQTPQQRVPHRRQCRVCCRLLNISVESPEIQTLWWV